MTESNCITLILRSSDRLNKANTTPAQYTLDLAGALTGFNNFLSRENETALYAVFLDAICVQAYSNGTGNFQHRRTFVPLEAINTQIPAATGFYQIAMDFCCPNKRATGGNGDVMFYLTTDSTNHTDINNELTHRNPVIVARSSLSNLLTITILDSLDNIITAVKNPAAPTTYLEHVIKLTIKPVR